MSHSDSALVARYQAALRIALFRGTAADLAALETMRQALMDAGFPG
jgi:hypothetical protein